MVCWRRWRCAGGDGGDFFVELGAKFIVGPILPRVGIPRVRPDKLYFYSKCNTGHTLVKWWKEDEFG